jgi:transposase-like protein
MTREVKITRAQELRENGISVAQIAKKLKVTPGTVYDWLKKAEVDYHGYKFEPTEAAAKTAQPDDFEALLDNLNTLVKTRKETRAIIGRLFLE